MVQCQFAYGLTVHRRESGLAGYHRGTPELRERAYRTLLEHGGAMQNHELAKIALKQGWEVHHAKMWGTHGLLNTLREEGRVVKVGRGRYAVKGSPEADLAHPIDNWSTARKRIIKTTMSTVTQSGKSVKRMLKGKELRCKDLAKTLDALAIKQGYRCAQTKILFDETQPELRASLDRLDSDGHYEDGSLEDGVNNLQLVTHWYNIAKGTRSDAAMMGLVLLHASHASEAANSAD